MLKQRRASNNLHQVLHAIRRALGAESIALHDEVVRLYPSGGLSVDVDLFEQGAAARAEAPITRHCMTHWHCGPARCYRKISTPVGQKSLGNACRNPCRINNTAWREAGGARRPGSRPLLPRAAGVHATGCSCPILSSRPAQSRPARAQHRPGHLRSRSDGRWRWVTPASAGTWEPSTAQLRTASSTRAARPV
jgi:hypothetical protein